MSGFRCQVSDFGKLFFQLCLSVCLVFCFCRNNATGQSAEIVSDMIQPLTVSETGTADAAVLSGTPAAEKDPDGNGMEVLCLPGVYLIEPDSCNPLGPSEYLTDYVEGGGVYPEPPFTGKKIDPALMDVPYQYARINVDNSEIIYLYNSPEEAANSINPVGSISSGAIRYVSYTDVVDIGSGHYVHSKGRDLWLRASPAAVSTSTLGRTFTKTPEYDFGWIVEGCNPYLEMDYKIGRAHV